MTFKFGDPPVVRSQVIRLQSYRILQQLLIAAPVVGLLSLVTQVSPSMWLQTLPFMALALILMVPVWFMVSLRLEVGEPGLVIVTGLQRHQLPWSSISGFEVRRPAGLGLCVYALSVDGAGPARSLPATWRAARFDGLSEARHICVLLDNALKAQRAS